MPPLPLYRKGEQKEKYEGFPDGRGFCFSKLQAVTIWLPLEVSDNFRPVELPKASGSRGVVPSP